LLNDSKFRAQLCFDRFDCMTDEQLKQCAYDAGIAREGED